MQRDLGRLKPPSLGGMLKRTLLRFLLWPPPLVAWPCSGGAKAASVLPLGHSVAFAPTLRSPDKRAAYCCEPHFSVHPRRA